MEKVKAKGKTQSKVPNSNNLYSFLNDMSDPYKIEERKETHFEKTEDDLKLKEDQKEPELNKTEDSVNKEREEKERLAEQEKVIAAKLEVERWEMERLEQEKVKQQRQADEEFRVKEKKRLEEELQKTQLKQKEEEVKKENERKAELKKEEIKKEQERIELEKKKEEADRKEKDRIEALQVEAERKEKEKIEALKAEAEKKEAMRQREEEKERIKLEALKVEEQRKEAERLKTIKLEEERRLLEKKQRKEEAEKKEKERLEALQLEAERKEDERKEKEKLKALKAEAEKKEAVRQEEEEKKEKERLEAIQLEAERKEAERQESERKEKESLEALRVELERKEAERLKTIKLEEERKFLEEEAEKQRLEKQEEEKKEKLRVEEEQLKAEVEKKEQERNEAVKRAEEKEKEVQKAEAEARKEQERLEALRVEEQRKKEEEARAKEAKRLEEEKIASIKFEEERKEKELQQKRLQEEQLKKEQEEKKEKERQEKLKIELEQKHKEEKEKEMKLKEELRRKQEEEKRVKEEKEKRLERERIELKKQEELKQKEKEKQIKEKKIKEEKQAAKEKALSSFNPEKYKIKFHVNTPDETLIKKLVTEMLIEDKVTPNTAEEFKTKVREPTYGLRFENIHNDIHPNNAANLLQDFVDHEQIGKVEKDFLHLYTYHVDQKREIYDKKYIQIENLSRPKEFNPSKKEKESKKWRPHENTTSPNKASSDFLKKQPRLNLNYNYNFEEHTVFTDVLKEAQKKDEAMLMKSEDKLLKYSNTYKGLLLELRERNLANSFCSNNVNEIRNSTGQEEKKAYNNQLFSIPQGLKNYEMWRSFDRSLNFYMDFVNGSKKVKLVPSELIKKFGKPGKQIDQNVTGHYIFEDSNLDVFMLYEHKQTTMSWGDNWEDEIYEKQSKANINPMFQIMKVPTPEEFWSSNEEKDMRIMFTPHAEWKKFIAFLKLELMKDYNIIDKLDEKFGSVDLYLERKERNNERKPVVYEYTQKEITSANPNVMIPFSEIYAPIKLELGEKGVEEFDNKFYQKLMALKNLERNKEQESTKTLDLEELNKLI
mmetsp:Transcript_5991/g.6212  ORF Transcript_5991/g.6212 Transcript_5991/m.6212 type:complete len:1058 (+) Transcript_5991:302-3475(+)